VSEDINKAENGLNSPETQPFDVFNNLFAGKYVNGTTLVVDGGLWLSHPRHIPKEEVKELSKLVEKKVRTSGVGMPSSKL